MRIRDGCRGAQLAVLAAALDRLTKRAAAGLPPEGAEIVPGILRLRRTVNRGMAFSMLSGQGALLAVLTALLLAGLAAYLLAKPDRPRLMRAGLWLIVGGGLGNLYDRLTAGAVIDFIEPVCVRFAVFNVADTCICVGAALAALGAILEEAGRRRDGSGV